MKLALSGKGGVGKTTLAALLAQAYADLGRNVLGSGGLRCSGIVSLITRHSL